jgi:hypothetical protein
MIKFTSPFGWDFAESPSSLVKLSSRGLRGADRAEFIKRASVSFLPELDQLTIAEDEVPVHLIALGATEMYGPNRNGDGFKVAACRKYHPTFTKFAKFYRNHRNKPAEGHPNYGQVKLSAFNEDMGRVELIVLLNASEKAAARNGGLLADAELEKLANGEDLSVSMAARVPLDVCSYCKNPARTRAEYCTAEKCAAGGCRDNLAQLIKVAGDLHHLHVDNPDPTWFDISRVYRPADRIAYGGRATYVTKEASDRDILQIQREVVKTASETAPLDVLIYSDCDHDQWTQDELTQLKLAYALASLERQQSPDAEQYRGVAVAPSPAIRPEPVASVRLAKLAALADRGIILTLPEYATMTGRSECVASAASLLPAVYSYGLETEKLARVIKRQACDLLHAAPATQAASALGLTSDRALTAAAAEKRAAASVIKNQPAPVLRKAANAIVTAGGEGLALDYAGYQVQSLCRRAVNDNQFPLTAHLAIRQNQASCPT